MNYKKVCTFPDLFPLFKGPAGPTLSSRARAGPFPLFKGPGRAHMCPYGPIQRRYKRFSINRVV